jgi:tight adherence protein B
MSIPLPILIAAGAFWLIGLPILYVFMARADAHRKRLAQRIASTLEGRAAAPSTDVAEPLRLSVPEERRSFGDRLATLIGADPARKELYPLPWWAVPVIALLPARLIALVLQYLFGPMTLIVVPFACWFLCGKFFAACHQRRINILFRQFPDALAMIVRAVRVGIPISEAIRAVSRESPEPTATEFGRLADEIAIGAPLDQALRTMGERNKVPEYRFFATALSLQAQTGGGIAETLENLADVIRKRVAARARGKALAAEARASATALAVLPGLALGVLSVMNPDYIGILFTTDAGNQILAAAVLMLCFGIYVMSTLIRKSLS